MFEKARYTIELLRAGYSREEIAELLAPAPEPEAPPAPAPAPEPETPPAQEPEAPPAPESATPPAGELETIRAEIDELRRNQQAQHIREADAPEEDDPETAIIKHFSK